MEKWSVLLMFNLKIPLWIIALIGLALVLGLYFYVTAQFTQITAYENSAYNNMSIDTAKQSTSLSSSEKKSIDAWIKKNNLNKYADPINTVYKDGPLKTQGGQNNYSNRFQYIVANHKDQPWNSNGAEMITQSEKVLIDAWVKQSGLNQFGDPLGTAYTGGTPLFHENGGGTIDLYVYVVSKHPDRPWSKVAVPVQ